MAQHITIDRLLTVVPDSPDTVLTHLSSQPDLASKQDSHGYSLLHAATSYNHASLAKALVKDYHVDVNIRDEDGETPLFVAENVGIARTLIEELGADIDAKNEDDQTAEAKMEEDGDSPLVAAYLREAAGQGSGGSAASVIAQTGGAHDTEAARAGTISTDPQSNGVSHPPPLPHGITDIRIGTMEANDAANEPDPEFRRRIEELAARDDFQGEEGQRQLRELVQDAVLGLNPGDDRSTRRRVD